MGTYASCKADLSANQAGACLALGALALGALWAAAYNTENDEEPMQTNPITAAKSACSIPAAEVSETTTQAPQ